MIEMDTFKEEARDVLHRIDKVAKIPVYYVQVDESYIRAKGGDPARVNENGVIFKKRDTKFYCLEDYYTGKPVNVKLWGVKGDGVTSDTLALDKAFVEAGLLKGILYFPAGVYIADVRITCSIKGEDGAVISHKGRQFNVENAVTIENIEFRGNNRQLTLFKPVRFINCKFTNLQIVIGSGFSSKEQPITFKDCDIYHTETAIRMNGIKLVMQGNTCTGGDGMFMALYDVDLQMMNNYIEAGTPVKVGEGGTNTGFVAFNVFKGQGNDIVGTIVQNSNITINAV